jgi:hypothetical protein
LDNIVRYCLPCSENAGVLVRRTAPALEKKRAASAERSKAKQATKRAKARESETRAGIHIPTEAARIWRLMKPYHRGRRLPPIKIRNRSWGTSGHCKIGNEIVLSISPGADASEVWNLISHELCHEARGLGYSGGKHAAHDQRFYAILTDVTRKRFGISVPLHEHRGKFGYAVDAIITNALYVSGLTADGGKPFIDEGLAEKRREKAAA